MRMELVQPFINSADAVLAQSLQCPTQVGDVSMEERAYCRKGVAAIVEMSGEIEGRIIFDAGNDTAVHVAQHLAGSDVEASDDLLHETVCELANMIIGNAITSLNDQGFHFKISPPKLHLAEYGFVGDEESEALVMCFETAKGSMFMNIALQYKPSPETEPSAVMS